MHELGIAMEIAELAVERAGSATPRRVIVEVGALTAVLPDALRFAWDAAIDGTELEGCALEIVEIRGRGRCTTCGAEQELERPFGRCTCGTTDLTIVMGEELRIRELEVT